MRRLLPLFVLLAGCDFYFGGDDDCATIGIPDGYPVVELRDPQTGHCQEFRTGGYHCDDACGPCYEIDVAAPPQWGACHSACNELGEDACLAAAGCQAAYDEDTSLQDAPSISRFTGCWAIAPTTRLDTCWDKDAYECAGDDSCAMYYEATIPSGTAANDARPSGWFLRCAPEPTTQGCELVDCIEGSHCELQCAPCEDPTQACPCTPTCVPDYNSCAYVACGEGYTCVEICDGMSPSTSNAIPPWQCQARCVPTGGGDPGACTGDVNCLALPPACPAGTVAGIANGCWTGYCIPQSACGPNDPGGCEPALCDAPSPGCPTGTVAGTRNGCYTGYCIPQSSCPQVTCEMLTDEAACSARGDCRAIYAGDNCTCDVYGCTCADLTFERCESQLLMPF